MSIQSSEKLRPALDIVSRIEGLPETSVLPKQITQGNTDKDQSQPPTEPKATAGPKDNVASVSKREKKKKKIGEDDEDEDDDIEDIMKGSPSKPSQKFKPSDQEIREKMNLLEKEMKEKELLEKKKSIFPEWTVGSLQKEVIDEPSIRWLEPVMSFGPYYFPG
uniref:Uncharacterized protein n=1 Tax=Lactuca sativa TaxID=4236 RepID=A0A9R1WG39_LACSA|nr:hypothetical protein LSAT_V11C100021830 [Lactuca sativa]